MRPQPTYPMPAAADIAIYSQDKRLALIVEVKGGQEPSDQGAAALRRSLIAHDLLANAPFFLLAYRTRLFLWDQGGAPDQPPDFSASTAPVLNDYAPSFSNPGSTLRESGLQLVLFAWLSDVANGAREPQLSSEPERMLVESGVYEKIRLGDVQFEAGA